MLVETADRYRGRLGSWVSQHVFTRRPALDELITPCPNSGSGRLPRHRVAEAYDFSGVGAIVDVGGATGNLLAAILSRYPDVRGVLFDQPHVVTDAPALLEARGVADRVAVETGSFFDGVPAGGDVYILSHIIHDWTEEQCVAILGFCRDAMNPGGRILIVVTVRPRATSRIRASCRIS